MTTRSAQETAISQRSREILSFLDTLQALPGDAVTACQGWTVHDIIAHLTAGCVAVADQAEAYGVGDPVPPFGSWAERDEAYRRIDDAPLRQRLDDAEARMTGALRQLERQDASQLVPGGCWGFTVSGVMTHFRQEFALHRWDFIGDDSVGEALLSQPVFVEHSVTLLGDWLLTRGMLTDPSPHEDFEARIRDMTDDDVVLRVADGVATLGLEARAECINVVHTDSAAGLLLIWGRHPRDSGRVRSSLSADHLVRLTSLLAGF